MFADGALSFREFAMREPLPLATIHGAVLEFLRGRDDAVLFGAQAVNAYVEPSRMTQDVDILSTRGAELAEELRDYLNQRFHIAVRVRQVRQGIGYQLYQVQKPKNRHLVDVRPVREFPPTRRVEEILVVAPAELVAGKLMAYQQRQGTPKSFTDLRDLAALLLAFPDLKTDPGPVGECLKAAGADAATLVSWHELVAKEIRCEEEDEEFEGPTVS
jgi:hypothetical protein